MPQNERTYIAIDLKSYYASVECMERGLDPMQTNLVVADPSRTEKTICLAVSPALKAYGIPGRARLFDGRRQHIELRIGPVGGQRDGLAVAEHGVVGVGFAHGEGHAVALDRGGNQLGGERTQRLVDRIVGEELEVKITNYCDEFCIAE